MRQSIVKSILNRKPPLDRVVWTSVPDAVRNDDEFLDLAMQAKAVEQAMADASGDRLVALHERQLSLFSRMRTRWNLVQRIPDA